MQQHKIIQFIFLLIFIVREARLSSSGKRKRQLNNATPNYFEKQKV
jgi:hypothetical protein